MIEQSFWAMEQRAGSAEISVPIDGLYNRLDVIPLDRPAAEAEADVAKRTADLCQTIAASHAVSAIAPVVCYPVTYAVARLEIPHTAPVNMLWLVIPYTISKLLRIFAWQMIPNQNRPANLLSGFLEFDSVPLLAVAFLESGTCVFVAMVYAYFLLMLFPLYNVLKRLDSKQMEVARDLGAATCKIHRRVVIPHARPCVAVGCITRSCYRQGLTSCHRL